VIPCPRGDGCVLEPGHDSVCQRASGEVILRKRKDASAAGVAFTAVGSWRVYFNAHAAAPRVWCVSPWDGSWEIAVASVELDTAAKTVYRAPLTAADQAAGAPAAWLEVDGQLIVRTTGHALIGEPDHQSPGPYIASASP